MIEGIIRAEKCINSETRYVYNGHDCTPTMVRETEDVVILCQVGSKADIMFMDATMTDQAVNFDGNRYAIASFHRSCGEHIYELSRRV